MKVIAGSAKGKTLISLPGNDTRPILDRIKTSLFDILRPNLQDTSWLDLFAGTGSVGIEALSQGASSCVFVDVNPGAIDVIRKNLSLTELRDKASVRNTDAFLYLRNTKNVFDVIYIAPPQYKALWEKAVYTIGEFPHLVRDNGILISQIDPKEYDLLELSEFKEFDQRRYGNTLLVFYRKILKI